MRRALLTALLLLFVWGCDDPAPVATWVVQASVEVPNCVPFRQALEGCSFRGTEDQASDLAQRPGVRSVSKSQPVHAMEVKQPSSGSLVALWNLDRINQRTLPLDGIVSFPNQGEGVTVYVLDTGFYDHADLAGRINNGADMLGGNGADCNGHSIHVSGIAAGSTFGIARHAQVVTVRVLDCGGSGTTEGVIRGLDWVLANASRPAVVNMSLGTFDVDTALNIAVSNVVRANIPVVVAAGNSGVSACNSSPSSAPLAITVGATRIDDGQAFFSNFGPCVDVFAPGEDIVSAWLDGGQRSLNGTSMASPHVAGACALALAAGDFTCATVLENATFAVTNTDPSIFLFTGPALRAPDNVQVVVQWTTPNYHSHVSWRDSNEGHITFDLQRSADGGMSWVTLTAFPKTTPCCVGYFNDLVRVTDLFRVRAVQGVSFKSSWSVPVFPTFLTAGARHGH